MASSTSAALAREMEHTRTAVFVRECAMRLELYDFTSVACPQPAGNAVRVSLNTASLGAILVPYTAAIS